VIERCPAALVHALVLALSLSACSPTLDARASEVDATRVLAVVIEPPEASPGEAIELAAVVGGPDGPLTPAPRWSFCTAPLPPGSPGVVSTACVDDPSALAAIGDGDAVIGQLPDDACARFGPDTPPGGFRPRDPDQTGGYQQPVRLDVEADDGALIAFAMPRVLCNLDSAPFEVARAYRERYRANRNPGLALAMWRGGVRGEPGPIAAGETVTLEASWSAADAEAYVSLDLASHALVDRREAMQVAWYATAGALAADATGRAEDDPATASRNVLTAPDAPGALDLWAVLRDSRGGVAVVHAALTVE
jgi:hypothetical protein